MALAAGFGDQLGQVAQPLEVMQLGLLAGEGRFQ
jgi:hypothetical protein